MTTYYHMSQREVEARVRQIVHVEKPASPPRNCAKIAVYGVPRGGVPVAYLFAHYPGYFVTDDPTMADLIVDDIIDSGATRERYRKTNPNTPFVALVERKVGEGGPWIVFPWEGTEETSAEDIPTRLLQFIGEDPKREGLRETPARFLKAWEFWTSGYQGDPAKVLKTFEDGGERYDELILVRDIPLWSTCEHHLAPFFGVAHVGYLPDRRIVGLSKLVRLVEMFARRLQVQERLTAQVADALQEHLAPRGVAVLLSCRHSCMESRGVQRAGATTVTSALRGVLLQSQATRDEFMRLAGQGG